MSAKKILVVEDDNVVQKVIADVLQSAGYEVLTARDPATAVQIVREQQPDLVTLDIELAQDSPNDSWDGFSVASWLQRFFDGGQKPVLVIISGARNPGELIERAAQLGVFSCLTKPVEKQALLDTVAEALK